jgi:ribosomal protein L20
MERQIYKSAENSFQTLWIDRVDAVRLANYFRGLKFNCYIEAVHTFPIILYRLTIMKQ